MDDAPPLGPVSRALPIETGLDFVNTLEHSRDHDTEHIPDASALVAWLHQNGVLDDDAARRAATQVVAAPSAAERVMSDARALRRALRSIVDAAVHHTQAGPRDIAIVNGWLRRRSWPRLVARPGRLALEDAVGDDPIRDALARLADAGARAVSGDVSRLRTCANQECRWAFYDTSRGGRRRWCDMTSCGNRAKARRHRERERLVAAPTVREPDRTST